MSASIICRSVGNYRFLKYHQFEFAKFWQSSFLEMPVIRIFRNVSNYGLSDMTSIIDFRNVINYLFPKCYQCNSSRTSASIFVRTARNYNRPKLLQLWFSELPAFRFCFMKNQRLNVFEMSAFIMFRHASSLEMYSFIHKCEDFKKVHFLYKI